MKVFPEILASVPAEDHELAKRALVVPLVSSCAQDLSDVISTQDPEAFDFLIVDGVVLKETTLAVDPPWSCLARAMFSHHR